jgi:hypothetical protein
VHLLGQALVNGYKRADTWNKEPDLAALRSREDFQKLLKDVADRPAPGTAAPLVVGKALEGSLTKDHPFDSFPMTPKSHHQVHSIVLEAGQPYLIDLQGKFDTFLRIENAQKAPLLYNDDIRPDDLNSRLVFIPPENGTYRVVVTSFKPGAVGAYTLSARKAVKEGKTKVVKDELQKTDKKNKDRYFKTHKVQLNRGSPYTIEMESQAFDTFLVLLDEKGQFLAENDDIVPGDTRRSRIDFTPKEDGTFIVVATSFGVQQTGAYTLTVQRYGAAPEPKAP